MPSPDEIGVAVSNYFNADVMSTLLKYVGYTLIIVAILGLMIGFYFYLQFKYKVYVAKLHFNQDGKSAQVLGFKKDYARDIKQKGSVIKQQLLFRRKFIQPFYQEDIRPGNKVWVSKINDDGTYVRLPEIKLEHNIAAFETLSPEENYWAVLQLKENENTYADKDAQKRILMYTLMTILGCFIFGGFVLWIAFRAPSQMAEASVTLADSLKNVAAQMGGLPPG